MSVFEEWTENGTQKSGEFIEACRADNVFKFNASGSGTKDDGAKKCDPSDPQVENFSWAFSNDQKSLSFLGTGFEIISMDNIQFKIKRIYNDGGGLMVTQTLTFSH